MNKSLYSSSYELRGVGRCNEIEGGMGNRSRAPLRGGSGAGYVGAGGIEIREVGLATGRGVRGGDAR